MDGKGLIKHVRTQLELQGISTYDIDIIKRIGIMTHDELSHLINGVKPFMIQDIKGIVDWGKYLEDLDVHVKSKGFEKHNYHFVNGVITYWKKYDNEYQIGVKVYDFRQNTLPDLSTRISVEFQCQLLNGYSGVLSSGEPMEIEDFEHMANKFYNMMSKYKA